jgi:predicted alpha/beta-hydrolase family hydrolase
MVTFAQALAARGVDAVTFNFLYTEQRRKSPDRPDALEACFARVVEAVGCRPELGGNRLTIGGKSMGGRIATHLAAGGVGLKGPLPPVISAVAGLVLLGYPLHPPGRPDQLRSAHLPRIAVPMLIVQGGRDTFGTPDELRPILATLPAPVDLHVVEGGDHSFKVPARQASQRDVYAAVQDRIAHWLSRTR